MKVNGFLKIRATKSGGKWRQNGLTITKNRPGTDSDEIAIKLEMDIPDAIFERPQLTAYIVVPEEDVGKPVIDSQVQDNIAEVLSESLGVKVHITAEVES